jgi:DNA-binding HxlR family transcriptional regulator
MKNQHHGSYCSAARSIEVVGEKWSLLVVRDLLYGPRRFSDLLATVGGVTPKLLTQRLRELEASGVIARDEEPGRRDVWYSLTEAGLALRPVVRELVLWGIYHGPPPEPDETSRSRRAAATVVAVFNREALIPSQPVVWAIDLGDGDPSPFRFDGLIWEVAPESPAPQIGLVISSTPRAWVELIRTPRNERVDLAKAIHVEGSPDQVDQFHCLFAV